MGYQKANVVIIGGGPSGSSCGIELLKNNCNVCILDKATFPRKKLCAGLITQKTLDILRHIMPDYDKTICSQSNVIELFHGIESIAKVEIDNPFLYTNREVFDHELLKHYHESGGQLLEHTTAQKIDIQNKLIYTSNNDVISYDYLIGADGANSFTRNCLGKTLHGAGFCLEVSIPRDRMADTSKTTKIHFGITKTGYGWVFPKKDHYTIGIIDKFIKGTDYIKIFQTYLSSLGVKNAEDIVLKGAFVPYGDVVDEPFRDENIFLVGDAAGFADPITGEGLYFALISGIEAAKAILSANPDKTLAYQTAIKNIRTTISEGKKLQKNFYRPITQKYFYSVAKNHSNFIRFFLDNQVSFYNYSYSKIPLFPIYYYINKFSLNKADRKATELSYEIYSEENETVHNSSDKVHK